MKNFNLLRKNYWDYKNQPITAPTSYAGFLQVANAILIVRYRAKYFAFAIQFSTFNKVFRLRQFCAINSAQLVAANRYKLF
jgi:hypothetical protein